MKTSCSKCASPLPLSLTEEFCPICSLAGALGEQERPGSEPPETIRYVGDYELIQLIARGGMGVVYRARQRSLGRTVAVKLMLGGELADKVRRQRFQAEAAAVARLQHPNIVAIHEVGEHHGQPFFSMDYIEGSTLAELVREQPLSARRAAELCRVITEAVHYAHTQGVLHRDLKPSNVLVDTFGQPRVSDFGLAKALDSDLDLTRSSQVLGSPAYMPPEQAFSERHSVGPHSDVYSLGAILYQLLTARAPFQGESPHAILLRVRDTEPVAPRTLNPDVPADLETICLKCLEKEPARRYLTADALANDLRRFLDHQPILARPVGIIGKTWRWSRRHRGLAVAIVTALAALATVAVVASITSVRVSRAREAAEKARAEATRRLAESLVSEAHALRVGGQPGFRAAALARLQEALTLDSDGRLRDRLRREAIAALVRPDIRHVTATNVPRGIDSMHCCFDAAFERCANATLNGRALYRVSDGERLQLIPKRGKIPDEIVSFSSDGRFVLLRFGRATQIIATGTAEVVLATNLADGPAAFSPDSGSLARGEEPGVVALYDLASVESNRHQARSKGRLSANGRLTSLAFDPEGKLLAVGDDGGIVSVCDARSGQAAWEQKTAGSAWHLAWSRDGELLAVTADRDRIFLLKARDGTLHRQINTPTDISTTVAFTPDGDRLACAGEQSGVRFFNSRTGRLLIADAVGSWHLLFDSSGQRLGTFLVAGRPGWIEWMPPVGVSMLPDAQFAGTDPNLTFSADGNQLLANGADTALLWDVSSRRLVRRVFNQSGAFINFGATTNELLISTRRSLLAQKIDVASANLASTGIALARGEWLWGSAITADGRFVAVADHNGGAVTVIDRHEQNAIRAQFPIRSPERVAFSPGGRWLVSGAFYDGEVLVWDWQKSAEPVAKLRPASHLLLFSRDGKWLLTFGRSPRLWRTDDWQPGPALPLQGSSAAATISPNGRWLAASQHPAGRDEIHLIDVASLRTLAVLDVAGEGLVRNLAFHPAGELLALSLGHDEVQLWDLPELRLELAKLGLDWQDPIP